MSITISPSSKKPAHLLADFCRNIENICFWNAIVYKIVESNFVANKTIGSLGPTAYQHLCPQYYLKYSLLNGKYMGTILKYPKLVKNFLPNFSLF